MNGYQPLLMAESIEQALADVVRALGGAKQAGLMLRPELCADRAARWLDDCLNHERAEKLSLPQVLMLLREGNRAGCHIAMSFIAQEAGYAAPQPVEPKDERAELQRQFIAASKHMGQMVQRIERLGGAA